MKYIFVVIALAMFMGHIFLGYQYGMGSLPSRFPGGGWMWILVSPIIFYILFGDNRDEK